MFFTYLGGIFVSYSFTTTKIMYEILFWGTLVLARATYKSTPETEWFWPEQFGAMKVVIFGVVGTFMFPNIVAAILRNVLNKA